MTLTPNPAPALTLTRRTSGESVWLERAPRLATIALRGSPAFASSIATWHADGVAMELDGVGTEWGRRGMWRQSECVNNVAASRSYERAASIQSVIQSVRGCSFAAAGGHRHQRRHAARRLDGRLEWVRGDVAQGARRLVGVRG